MINQYQSWVIWLANIGNHYQTSSSCNLMGLLNIIHAMNHYFISHY